MYELNEEEHKIIAYINQERPELRAAFFEHLPKARRGILHRFLQAVIRENIAGIGERAEREGQGITLHLPNGQVLHAPVMHWHTLDRFEFGELPIEHPVELLDLLQVDSTLRDRFRQELQNSVANYALALAGADIRKKELTQGDAQTALDYARRRQRDDETFSPLAFFEQWVIEGHPLHPGAKIKMGLDVADVIRYSPEWGATPNARLVAVSNMACKGQTLGRRVKEILFAEHAGLQAQVDQHLRERGLNPQEYDLIPLHPWQYEHTLPRLYQAAFAKNELVPIPNASIPTAALMSFRSLAPHQPRTDRKHHIKTAVNIQTTGAIRTVSPNSAENGPLLSIILRHVQEREGHFAGRFLILEERAGIYYNPSEETLTTEERHLLGRNCAAILRENPEQHVAMNEIAMPASALIAESPISGKPIVAELIEAYAASEPDGKHAAIAFLRHYAETALPGFLTVMSRYGISLEGHLQNSIAVFRNGTPVRMILRDFGGVRLLRERVEKHGLTAAFYPGSATIIDDVTDLRNKIFYPVFQNHFGELILCIANWYGLPEQDLWQQVAHVCRTVFADLKRDPQTGSQAAEDEKALFAETLDLKAMATMRLLGDVTTYTFAKVANPLGVHAHE